MELQELISRGRFLFSGAIKRFEIFKLINGKKSAKEIAIKVDRSFSSVLQDIEKMEIEIKHFSPCHTQMENKNHFI